MRNLILVVLLAAAGCDAEPPTVNGSPAYDLWGNRYPSACLRDMSDIKDPYNGKPVPITFMSQEKLDALGHVPPGKHLLGWTQYLPPRIFVLDTLSGRRLEEAIRHERCHVVAGEWHK